MKKRGFTLIELLAAIAIIGILSVLVIPSVLKTYNEAVKNSNVVSYKNIVKAIENQYDSNELNNIKTDDTNFIYEDGEVTKDGNFDFSYSGEKIKNGELNVTQDGIVEFSLYKNNACYVKTKTDNNILIYDVSVDECKISMANTNLCYDFFNGTIYDYDDSCPKNVVIPSQINGENVKIIGSEAFANKGITKVIIPEGVERIGEFAFARNSITKVTLPSSLEYIQRGAFNSNQLSDKDAFFIVDEIYSGGGGVAVFNYEKDYSVTPTAYGDDKYLVSYGGAKTSNVIIPNNVTIIGDHAFVAVNLQSVFIPDSVETIGSRAFAYNLLTNIEIPSSVTSIENGAFWNNQLTSVTLNSGLEYIAEVSFSDNQITNVVIPNSVTYIGWNAFHSNLLTDITIPSSVTTIESSAFNNNTLPNNQAFIYARNSDGTIDNTTLVSYGGAERNNVTIPSGVVTLGSRSLAENDIANITIPNSVVDMWDYALAFNNLTSVVIPNSVTQIYRCAFEYNHLTNATIPNTVVSIGSDAFANNRLVNVNIPNSVTTIWSRAFKYNKLTSVSLSNNVTYIGSEAFMYNDITEGNAEIDNNVSNVTVESNAFSNNGADRLTTIIPTYLR